jgi:hypothetical protein
LLLYAAPSTILVGEEGMSHVDPSGYALGWGTLSLINAGLAQGKGRSGLNWWLISLLLGPVATLIIVLLPVADHDKE